MNASYINQTLTWIHLHDESQSFYSSQFQHSSTYQNMDCDFFSTIDSKEEKLDVNPLKIKLNIRKSITKSHTVVWAYWYPSTLTIGTKTQSKFSANALISASRDVSNSFKMNVAVATVIHSFAWIVDSMKIVGFPYEVMNIKTFFGSFSIKFPFTYCFMRQFNST